MFSSVGAVLLEPPAPPPDDEFTGVEVDAAQLLAWAQAEPVGAGLVGLLAEIDPAELDTEGQLRLAALWSAAEGFVAAGKLSAVAAAAGPNPPPGPRRGGDFRLVRDRAGAPPR